MPAINLGGFTVFLIDDDQGALKALSNLLRSVGYRTEAYIRPQTFLDEHDGSSHGCAVLDLSMPGLNGLGVQQELVKRGIDRPIIFLTGRATVPASVEAFKAGAVDFLTKPVKETDLLNAIKIAEQRDSIRLRRDADRKAVRKRIDTLTSREREVMDLIIRGVLNKNIAADMGRALKTVKVHRGRAMKKMGVKSVAELVRMVSKLSM